MTLTRKMFRVWLLVDLLLVPHHIDRLEYKPYIMPITVIKYTRSKYHA